MATDRELLESRLGIVEYWLNHTSNTEERKREYQEEIDEINECLRCD